MKIRARVDPPTMTEFEVELPLYRVHDCGGDDYNSMHYMRIDTKVLLRCVTIIIGKHFNDDTLTYKLEIDTNYHFDDRSSADYNLGRGEYALTKEKWDTVMKEMKEILEAACT
jgi:hypothetical protein